MRLAYVCTEWVIADQVCNHGLRLMLRGETHRLAEYQDELSRYGQAFTDRSNMAGATFIYVLYKWGTLQRRPQT